MFTHTTVHTPLTHTDIASANRRHAPPFATIYRYDRAFAARLAGYGFRDVFRWVTCHTLDT